MRERAWIDDVAGPLRGIALEHGAFLRREVIALGLEDRDLQRQVRAKVWVRVRHGAYTFADVWEGADESERHRIRTRAATRVLGERVAVSHHSSCLLHRLPLWGADLTRIHVTRRDGGAGRAEGDLWHHESLLLPEDVVTVGGVLATRPVRAALESASLLTVEQGLSVVDAGLQQGLYDQAGLVTQQLLMQSWPGSQHLQLVTRLADARSESVGESRSRYLFWVQGLPAPVSQYQVWEHGELVAQCDFAWPEHGLIVEFDGKEKYVKHLRPGETAGDAVFREKCREDEVRRITGWRVIRITWADLYRPERTAAIIRAALSAAV